MNSFNTVLANIQDEMGYVDYSNELQVWLNSLSKFNAKKPFPRSLFKQIDNHFNFYNKNDKLANLSMNDPVLKMLPKGLAYN